MSTDKIRNLPSFDELPTFDGFPGCAWEVWGKGDQLGTVNLLTEEVVKEASKEIKCVLVHLAASGTSRGLTAGTSHVGPASPFVSTGEWPPSHCSQMRGVEEACFTTGQ